MSVPVNPASSPPAPTGVGFDWPLCREAEQLLRGFVDDFLRRNPFARRLAERMLAETGTDFFEWVDHLRLPAQHETAIRNVGMEVERVEAPPGVTVYWHPRAMLPRVLLSANSGHLSGSDELAIKPEVLTEFIAAHDLDVEIAGGFGARLRTAVVAREGDASLIAVERLGYRGFVVTEPAAEFVRAVLRTRERWQTRKRDFADDSDGVRHAFARQDEVLGLLDRDAATELFFAEERAFWQRRNRAARVQKCRQDRLGLGWGNHDHHTFRCSREHFADLMLFLERFGFRKRERYYAGAEAGWGAQILEQPVAGIVVFADVDLMPDETQIDFSTQRLPVAPQMRTVGLWCGLHGDSFLQAGMHHLEARFDFGALREQLAMEGVTTMKPFSDFDFLRQAFTEGERWPVQAARISKLLACGLITREQADTFSRDGALGSHLENLQRKGGFKGFNQKSVSVIIAATDPRKLPVGAAAH